MKNPRKFLLDAKNILGKLLFVISHPRKYKRGYIREDGMIFWAWSYSCKNNERWVDQETFDRYVTKSREWIKSRSRAWYRENLDRERARGRKTGKKYRERHPEAIRKRYAVWYQKNGRKRNGHTNAYALAKKASDPMYKLKCNIRNLLIMAFKMRGYKKNTKTKSILGCSFSEFKAHMENQFTQGMSWNNRPLWHIDHIIPMATAKTEEDVIKLNHYKNLRPLWAEENRKKAQN